MKWSVILNRSSFPNASLAVVVGALLGCCSLRGADTAFRYQGALELEGQPAEGIFDFRFALHSADTGDTQLGDTFLALAVAVTNGLVVAEVDFGPGLFNGDTRWLEIAVRPSGVPNGFVALEPRQPVRAAPHALFALEAATATSAGRVSWQGITDVPEGFADGIDNDTLYAPGIGLDLVDGTFSLQFDGSGSADSAARSDHGHGFDELSGSVSDGQLGTNVARLDTDQVFHGTNQFDGVVLLTNIANVVIGTFDGDGAGLTNLQGTMLSPGSIGPAALADASVIAAKIAPGAVESAHIAPDAISTSQIADASIQPGDLDLAQFDGSFWKLDGNSGVSAGFLGTTDDRPLELRVQGTRALRLEPNGTNSVNVVAGSAANVIDTNIWGATIAGGGSASYLGAPHVNRVGGDFASIGGGSRNVIEPTAQWSTISGGLANTVRLNSQWSTIAGGNRNQIEVDADGSSILGGRTNTISPGATGGFIGGGAFNRILTNASYASIPGGQSNSAAANFTFAAGRQAAALHDGAFVWADASALEQPSDTENQFTVRAAGGTRIFSDANSTAGVELPAGSGSWSTLSDRRAKHGFAPVDARDVLERLTGLPLHTWSYRTESPSTLHLGPTAQDFHAQFDLGTDDRHIATVDADGVALAGIQGLNLKLEESLKMKDAEIEALRDRIDRLSARLDAIMGLSSTNP